PQSESGSPHRGLLSVTVLQPSVWSFFFALYFTDGTPATFAQAKNTTMHVPITRDRYAACRPVGSPKVYILSSRIPVDQADSSYAGPPIDDARRPSTSPLAWQPIWVRSEGKPRHREHLNPKERRSARPRLLAPTLVRPAVAATFDGRNRPF